MKEGLPPNFSGTPRIGLDMGGTLSKIVYFSPHKVSEPALQKTVAARQKFMLQSTRYGETGKRDEELAVESDVLGGSFHFVKFETAQTANFFKICRDNNLFDGGPPTFVTGGGARKFEHELTELNRCTKVDELLALVRGLEFLLSVCKDEAFNLVHFDLKQPIQKNWCREG